MLTQNASDCSSWIARLSHAVDEGLSAGLPDDILERCISRIMELEVLAQEQGAAAKEAAAAKATLLATPIRSAGSLKRLKEGTLVELQGMKEIMGISQGCFECPLGEYEGRKGRVSREPPPWVIKAGEAGGGLVPVLLDSRSSDADRHRGVWIAVPPGNLKLRGANHK